MSDAVDLGRLRVTPEMLTQVAKAQAKPSRPQNWRRVFVRVPWTWVERLRKAKRPSTYQLAMLLLYEHWRSGGHAIVLSNAGLVGGGIDRRSKWRGLAELEGLGLVRVGRGRGRSPRVHVLETGRN
jgi:hypothetical protein